MPWPPPHGWIEVIAGRELPDEDAERFENGKTEFKAKTIRLRARQEIDRLKFLGQEVPPELAEKAKKPPDAQPTNPKSIRKAERKKAKKLAKVKALEAKLAMQPPAQANAGACKAPQKAAKREARKVSTSMGAVFVDGVNVVSNEFLGTYAWRQLRMRVLAKYGPRCMCCGASPDSGAVMNVDHIKPRRLFPHLALDFENLQVLCHDCNHGKGNWDQTDWRKKPDPAVVAMLRDIARNG